MNSGKFEAGQKHATSWGRGKIPIMVEILKRTAKTVKIHVTAPPLTSPEGESFTRNLLVNERGESFYPLGSYMCCAPLVETLNQEPQP